MSTAKEMYIDFLRQNPTERTFTFIVKTFERGATSFTKRKTVIAPTLFTALVKTYHSSGAIGDDLEYYGFPVDYGDIDDGESGFSIEEFEEALNDSDENIASAFDEVNGDGADYFIIMEGNNQWVGEAYEDYDYEDFDEKD